MPIVAAFEAWSNALNLDGSGHIEPASLNLVTEYMDGGALDKLLLRNEKPLQEELIGTWTAQIVLAIDHMHRRSLLHRDIKPANIFITQSGLVKLGDLGAVRCSHGPTRP